MGSVVPLKKYANSAYLDLKNLMLNKLTKVEGLIELKLKSEVNLIKKIINEKNFSEAALNYSISDTANKGGKLGWVSETIMSPKIKKIVKKIEVGNYTKPIVIPGGFLILKIDEIREVNNNSDLDTEINQIIKNKTNEQLNQFSNIYFNKI